MYFKYLKRLKKFDQKLILNIFSLSSINIIRFIINLITLPHLIGIYGPERWGEIVFFQVIINYFIWIIDWSLDQHSSKLISINENNPHKQNEIFKSSISAQFPILVICLFIINFYSILFALNKYIYFYTNLILIGNFLQPHWYLYGREKIYESAIILLINRLLFSFFILTFINPNSIINDYFLLMGISSFFTGIIFFIRIFTHYNIKLGITDFKSGILVIRKSFRLFISGIWESLKNSLASILIGSYIGQFDLGIFNIAERIKSLAVQTLHPITQSIFPRISKKYIKDKKEANKSFLKILIFNLSISFMIYVFVNLYIYQIVNYFSEDYVNEIVSVLRIFIIIFILDSANEQFINNYFVTNNMYNFINNNKIFKFILFISLIFPLMHKFEIMGVAFSILISELVGLIIVLKKFCLTKNYVIKY